MSNTTNTTLHTVALSFVISADKATQKGIDAGAVTGTQQVRALTSKALSPVQFQTPDSFYYLVMGKEMVCSIQAPAMLLPL
ncbi:TPA: hypothetical protein ACQQX6_001665 [Yersinia enterocolitica]|nr:hypothetical protein [Yersinia enterocolitica]HDZ9660251.1 hypothetical protein [Yersinia enterocolitica]HEM6601581.1 hypothetical protein [Yersinia enterocolitica]HEN3538107.1 hypothetical protein [Yersinia enterocolitica]